MIKLFIFVFAFLLIGKAQAQCGVSYSCAVPICTGACYASDAAKKKAEEDGKCRAANKCEAAAISVKEVLDKTPKSDPTYGFYRNQNCIASKSCADAPLLDSSKWLGNVVNDFIAPLVNEEGKWKDIKKQCGQIVFPPKGLQCQKLMADYHIGTDLQNSVNKNGCGSEKDWNQVGKWLKDCIEKGVKEDVISGGQTIGYWVGVILIEGDREKIRSACKSDRKSRGLKVEE